MRRSLRLFALVGIGLLGPAAAHAHIELKSPKPRTLDQKTGPCGASGSVRGANVTTYRPGETITVEWDETVDHPGHYRIAFDDNGNDSFQIPRRPDDSFPQTLADQIADRSGSGHYTQQITLPNISCTNCTLQLIQVMTTAVPYDSFYFQCADLVLDGEAPGPGPGPDPGPADTDGGCAAGSPSRGLAAGLAVLALTLLRRRRRHGSC
jgi:MYXO-CTERM domain-containing protein